MKQKVIIWLCVVFCTGCGNSYRGYRYDHSGSRYASYPEPAPSGMVLIPSGAIPLGNGHQDTLWGFPADTRWVSLDAFWMDETEVTNVKYRQFVHWVRDSIIRERLYDPLYGGDELFKITEDRYGEPVSPRLNWNRPIPWNRPLEEESMAIESLYVVNPVTGEKSLDGKQLNFHYQLYDHAVAIHYQKELEELRSGASVSVVISKDTAYVDENGKIVMQKLIRPLTGYYDFLHTYMIPIYPDEGCWLSDFAAADNTRYARTYFQHSQYDHYPVVGVSWQMATAYCAWRTLMHQRQMPEGVLSAEFRLPTETEWEYAARAGKTDYIYPWGNQLIKDEKGCLPGNFKPMEGNYPADRHLITSPVRSYPPNEFGLYDMAGNVSEWSFSSYTPGGYEEMGELNPGRVIYGGKGDQMKMNKKVIKGGSWKDLPPFVRSDWRGYEYSQTGRSYIGFRCVKSYTGTPKKRK